MRITGTFLDEISHDIPHQNWGYKEWDRDFQSMKSIGIDTVIMIRCGHRDFITYPSKVLAEQENCLIQLTCYLKRNKLIYLNIMELLKVMMNMKNMF